MARAKPHTIVWPFTPKTAEDIDYNFDRLFGVESDTAGALPVTQGGTGLRQHRVGDVLYAQTPTQIAGLHDVAEGHVLRSGGVHTPPAYGKVALAGPTPHVEGVLPIAHGGTGETAPAAAFDALAPTAAKGDLIAHDGAGNRRVPIGADGQALVADATATAGVQWRAVTSTLLQADAHTDTLTQPAVRGDLVVARDTGSGTRWQRLPVGAGSLFLKSNGVEPIWTAAGDIGHLTASAQPHARVRLSTAQPIASGANPGDVHGGWPVPFDVVEADPEGFFSGFAPTRLTVPVGRAGTYVVIGHVAWATMAAWRAVWIYKNGLRVARMELPGDDAGLGLAFRVSAVLALAVTDYVEVFVRHEAGTVKDLLGSISDHSLTSLHLLKLS